MSGIRSLATQNQDTAIAVAEARVGIGAGCLHTSATRATVIRRLCTGQQLAIRVDLKEALRDPRENIPVWPGDTILTY